MSALGACPLCREVLPGDNAPQTCPGCGADLRPYLELQQRVGEYIRLCRELVSRGELERARSVLEQLPAFAEVEPGLLAELQTRLALAARELQAAELYLGQCPGPVQAELAEELALQQAGQQTAHELYNYALSAARRGEYRVAAEQLARAVAFAPAEAALWELKLKADLKCGFFARSYEDLRQLDLLAARPPKYAMLEQQLPPVC